MEFDPLPDLLKTGFTTVEISLLYGGEHIETKICRLLTKSLLDGDSVWLSTKSGMKCENTSNTGCVLLMFY